MTDKPKTSTLVAKISQERKYKLRLYLLNHKPPMTITDWVNQAIDAIGAKGGSSDALQNSRQNG